LDRVRLVDTIPLLGVLEIYVITPGVTGGVSAVKTAMAQTMARTVPTCPRRRSPQNSLRSREQW